MKKLVLAASLFIAFAASAQQRGDERRNENFTTNYQYQNKALSKIRLTDAQEKKIAALSRERLNERDYDAKIKKILTKQQYEHYLAYNNNWKKDDRFAMNGQPYRR